MLCPMTVQWRFIGQTENRKSLNNGESAGIRTQDPRLKMAVPWPKHTLQINSLQRFCKITGSQFRQRDFNNLYAGLSRLSSPEIVPERSPTLLPFHAQQSDGFDHGDHHRQWLNG